MLRFQVKFDLKKLPTSSESLEDVFEEFGEGHGLLFMDLLEGTYDTAIYGAYTDDDKPSYDLMRNASMGSGLPEYTREEYEEEFSGSEYTPMAVMLERVSKIKDVSYVISLTQIDSIGGGLSTLRYEDVNT